MSNSSSILPKGARLQATSKQEDIETLRGLAVILMVMGHVVGFTGDSGIQVGEHSAWRQMHFTLAPFRMPLFTVIAGYVYALRPISRLANVGPFLTGRFRRLVPPLVVGTVLFIGIRNAVPAAHSHYSPNTMLEYFILPQAHFWFLWVMLWISLLLIPIELFGLFAGTKRAAFMVVIFGVLSCLELGPPELAISETVEFFPFFLFGMGIQRFWGWSQHSDRAKSWLVAAVLSLMALHQLDWYGVLKLSHLAQTGSIRALGFLSVALAFALRQPIPSLARIGSYSYGIYLYHVHATAGSRVMLQHVGVEAKWVLFLAGTAAGVVLPMVWEKLADPIAALRLMCFGRVSRIARPPRKGQVVNALPPSTANEPISMLGRLRRGGNR